MPEGDTVWRTAHHLHQALAGRELTRTDLRVPAFATVDLSGLVVDEVVSRGKHLLVRVGGHSIHSHLKMEGAWHVYRREGRWRRPSHSARAVLENDVFQAVGFSLGVVEVLSQRIRQRAVLPVGSAAVPPGRECRRPRTSHRPRPNDDAGQPRSGGADLHGQHPLGRGPLGVRTRTRQMPALQLTTASGRARRHTDPYAQRVLVPPMSELSGVSVQTPAGISARPKTISWSRSVRRMSYESRNQFCRIVHGERAPCCGRVSATRVT